MHTVVGEWQSGIDKAAEVEHLIDALPSGKQEFPQSRSANVVGQPDSFAAAIIDKSIIEIDAEGFTETERRNKWPNRVGRATTVSERTEGAKVWTVDSARTATVAHAVATILRGIAEE